MKKKKDTITELIDDFTRKAEKATSEYEGIWKENGCDELYKVDIHIWRKPGMGNSLQTIVGNKVSIATATFSYLNTLIKKEVITLDELEEMIDYIKNGIGEE